MAGGRRFQGINHMAVACPDMDVALRYWRDLVGLRVLLAAGKPGSRQYFLEVSETSMLTIFEWEGVEPIAEKEHGHPVKGPFGFDHVSIGMADEESLWDLKERIDAAGFWVSEVIDHGFIWSIYTFDPNGLAVEFTVNSPENDIRQNPVMADREPPATLREGMGPQDGHWPEPGDDERTPPEKRRRYPGEFGGLFRK